MRNFKLFTLCTLLSLCFVFIQGVELYKFDNSTEALCLDGSPAGFYYEAGTTDNFLIYLQGGGACEGATKE
jgi:hypothetical protein